MSVRFISGKPGGGKSLYAVTIVLRELRQGSRCIVTNLPLKVGEICAYLQAEDGQDYGARQRILLLDPDQVGEFHRWYRRDAEPCGKTKPVKSVGGKVREFLSYEERLAAPLHIGLDLFDRLTISPGVLYLLDELHEFFNARKWAETGEAVLHYLSQHRKMGDDVVCITQSIGNVDKQFRSVAQDFTYLRNRAKESLPFLGGLIRSVRAFTRETYLEPYTGTQTSVETRLFSLDPKVASCYDTAAGVGIQGAGADKGDVKKGLPPWSPVVLLVALGMGIWYLPDYVAGKAAGTKTAQIAIHGAKEEKPLVSTIPAAALSSQVPVSVTVTNQVQAAERVAAAPKLHLTGIRAVKGRVYAYLSDGSVYTDVDGLEAVGTGVARIKGEVYRFKYGGS